MVPRIHTVLRIIPNIKSSVIIGSRNDAHSSFNLTTSDVQSQFLVVAGIHPLSTVITRTQPSFVISATIQYPCSTDLVVESQHALTAGPRLTTVARYAIDLPVATIYLASSDAQPSVREHVLCPKSYVVQWFSISTYGKSGGKHYLCFFWCSCSMRSHTW